MCSTSPTREQERAFSPARVIRDIVEELRPLAGERGNRIVFDALGDGVEDRYLGQPMAFSRVIYNLAGNAINFTERGEISVTMICTRHPGSDRRRLAVAVADTGPGIAPEDQQRIFDMFQTASARGAAQGTGFGLVIARSAVERMGGKIRLDSRPGQGSRFSFEIDLADAGPGDVTDERMAAPGPDFAGARALVVDDNPVNRTVLREMMSRLGCDCRTAEAGTEAVNLARGTAFDVILMDVSMPGMDGHEATRRIRGMSGASANSVILGVTALAAHDSCARTSSGMQEMLAKPLTPLRLAQAIGRHLTCEAPIPAERPGGRLAQAIGPGMSQELVRQSLEDARAALAALDDPAAARDAVAERVHYAIGSAAMVELTELSTALRRAETAARAGDPLEPHRQAVSRALELVRSEPPAA